jgi:hypothetical protein
MADTARVLVVANRTAESAELIDALKRRAAQSPVEFTMLLPSTPHGLAWVADMHAGEGEATEHLDGLVERLRDKGLEVREAKVGDPDALAAAQDEANLGDYDEIVVSTLPLHISKWLRIDLPHKVGHATGLPVTHVVAHEARAAAG